MMTEGRVGAHTTVRGILIAVLACLILLLPEAEGCSCGECGRFGCDNDDYYTCCAQFYKPYKKRSAKGAINREGLNFLDYIKQHGISDTEPIRGTAERPNEDNESGDESQLLSVLRARIYERSDRTRDQRTGELRAERPGGQRTGALRAEGPGSQWTGEQDTVLYNNP